MERIWSIVDANWRLFRSLKLTVFLLITLAVGSAVGSFFPQLPQQPGLNLEQLQGHYAPWLWWLLGFFQIFDLFHSWWFSLAMVALTLNLWACSLPRLVDLIRDLRRPMSEPPANAKLLKLAGLPAGLEPRRLWLAKLLGLSARWFDQDGVGLRFERGRWGRPGFVMVHLGLSMILVAGAWSQLAGRDGSLVLEPGQQGEVFLASSSDGRMESLRLPFAVRCKDFYLEKYGAQAGSVRDYVSELEILEQGRLVSSRRVEVNQPLAFGGYHFYQTAFQRVPSRDMAWFQIQDRKGTRRIQAETGDSLAEDERGVQYKLEKFSEDFKGYGPAAKVSEDYPDGRKRSFWVMERHPGLVAAQRPGSLSLDMTRYKPGYATVLSVARDPATSWIWLGSTLMMMGLVLVFFLRHKALWLRSGPEGSTLYVWAHRGQGAFVAEVREKLVSAEVEEQA